MDTITKIVRQYNTAVAGGERRRLRQFLYQAVVTYDNDHDPQPGSLECRYVNYVLAAIDLEWKGIKTFDQWMAS